jgi:hypothetical protein
MGVRRRTLSIGTGVKVGVASKVGVAEGSSGGSVGATPVALGRVIRITKTIAPMKSAAIGAIKVKGFPNCRMPVLARLGGIIFR